MDVLLTNDDGLESAGLEALEDALLQAGRQVAVYAPDRDRSATSHSVTIFRPLTVLEVPRPGRHPAHAVAGTPADCVKLALHQTGGQNRPRAVASGINLGANVGINVLYSGTIGGAFEGVLAGIPSFALSVRQAQPEQLPEVARVAVLLMERILDSGQDHRGVLYNVNFPAGPVSAAKGVRLAPQGLAAFEDAYERREDPRGRPYFWLSGEQQYMRTLGGSSEPDDLAALEAGHIVITPLACTRTDGAALERLARAGNWESILSVVR